MKILQVTDVHIARPGIDTFGVDVRQSFENVLKRVREIDPDHVVLSGDLCFREPELEIYKWISDRLSEYSIKPYIIPGNHDSNAALIDVFKLTGVDGEIYYKVNIAGVDCLFLDTGPGTMSENQYTWLSNNLIPGERAIIFMHHPPAVSGVPYMDNNHAFQQMQLFTKAVGHYKGRLDIFCGHYHVDRVIESGNLSIAITPSTFFQIRSDQDDFGIDHYRAGYRIIEIVPGGIRHWVEYL